MNRGPECNDRCYGESCVHNPPRPQHVYISGPMRGRDGFNFPAFFVAEEVLSAMFPGAEFFNPAREDVNETYDTAVNNPMRWGAMSVGGLLLGDPSGLKAGRYLAEAGGDFDLRGALARDMAFITSRCDMIVMLDGWENSLGAKAEKALCEALGVPVRYQDGAEYVGDAPGGHSEPPASPWSTAPGDVRADLLAADYRMTVEDFFHTPEAMARAEARAEQRENESWITDRILAPREPGNFTFTEKGSVLYADLDGEVRTTSANGGEKGVKLARFDLIPIGPLTALAEHYGRGARKYADHQWRKGYEWSKSYGAAMRHWTEFWAGRDWDVCPEDRHGCQEVGLAGEPFVGETEHGRTCFNHLGSHHLDAAAWHAFCLREGYDKHPEMDDRYKGGQ